MGVELEPLDDEYVLCTDRLGCDTINCSGFQQTLPELFTTTTENSKKHLSYAGVWKQCSRRLE